MAEYDFRSDLRYTREDEWVRADGAQAVIGVTDYAQQQLGDIVFVELPEVGRKVAAGEAFGVIESVKAVSDLYSPLTGTVSEVNAALTDQPESVNEDCYGGGWMIKIDGVAADELDALLDVSAYQKFVEERAE